MSSVYWVGICIVRLNEKSPGCYRFSPRHPLSQKRDYCLDRRKTIIGQKWTGQEGNVWGVMSGDDFIVRQECLWKQSESCEWFMIWNKLNGCILKLKVVIAVCHHEVCDSSRMNAKSTTFIALHNLIIFGDLHLFDCHSLSLTMHLPSFWCHCCQP